MILFFAILSTCNHGLILLRVVSIPLILGFLLPPLVFILLLRELTPIKLLFQTHLFLQILRQASLGISQIRILRPIVFFRDTFLLEILDVAILYSWCYPFIFIVWIRHNLSRIVCILIWVIVGSVHVRILWISVARVLIIPKLVCIFSLYRSLFNTQKLSVLLYRIL